ncbi:MAG: hypothetical protein CL610_00225 [Anaerolineaceae bacterium]|nr:hypothetical protein [Anaerolineaceae bacterium]
MGDKGALVTSNAGMRLIAQQTLLNRGDADRLRHFIRESYTPDALETQSVDDRLADLQQTGKQRVFQVLAVDKHQALVLMQAQRDEGLYMTQINVEEDYPHRITVYSQQPLNEA